jgi:hypothetical protein
MPLQRKATLPLPEHTNALSQNVSLRTAKHLLIHDVFSGGQPSVLTA